MESGWERDVEIHKGLNLCLYGGSVGGGGGVVGSDGDGGESIVDRSGGGGGSVVQRSVGGRLCRSV